MAIEGPQIDRLRAVGASDDGTHKLVTPKPGVAGRHRRTPSARLEAQDRLPNRIVEHDDAPSLGHAIC